MQPACRLSLLDEPWPLLLLQCGPLFRKTVEVKRAVKEYAWRGSREPSLLPQPRNARPLWFQPAIISVIGVQVCITIIHPSLTNTPPQQCCRCQLRLRADFSSFPPRFPIFLLSFITPSSHPLHASEATPHPLDNPNLSFSSILCHRFRPTDTQLHVYSQLIIHACSNRPVGRWQDGATGRFRKEETW